MDSPDDLIDSLLPAVEQQLHSPETGYVKKAYDKLIGKHEMEDEEARDLIAYCLAIITDEMMRTGRPFEHKKYRKLLEKLPTVPE